jgi:hypothetical protein
MINPVKIVNVKTEPTIWDRMASVVRDDDDNGNWFGILLVTIIIAVVAGTGAIWLNNKIDNNFHSKQLTELRTNYENEIKKEQDARIAVEELNKKAQKDINTAYVVSTTLQRSLEDLRKRNEEANDCLNLVVPNQLRQ